MKKILFIDRDGTLIKEPENFQVDRLEKFQLVEHVIIALLRLKNAGYRFVMVSNQEGLGTDSFPEETFWPVQNLLVQILESQGIYFDEILIDRSFEYEYTATRKPQVGMLLNYLKDSNVLWANCAVIGDRDSDLKLAENLGCKGYKLVPNELNWLHIADDLLSTPRCATITRNTKETQIRVVINLDASGSVDVNTGIGFFDHMIEQLGKHAGISLQLTCVGDTHIDEHHSVEDCAIALGQAFKSALGDKFGIARYAFNLPMDEARVDVVLDISNRSYFKFSGEFPSDRVGAFPTELVPHFFQSFAEAAGFTLHISVYGENTHHMVEACFKSFARTLKQAIAITDTSLPSTKGLL